jgi:quinolinate synthase
MPIAPPSSSPTALQAPPVTDVHPTSPQELVRAIKRLKQELDAVILAHYYQDDPIQDIADFIGDSLQLARQAATTPAKVIVFCGVHFMAETAKILNPHKQVLLPDLEAGCSLSDSCPADRFREFIQAHPGHLVLTYVNSSAAVKALSDYCVTSSNACAVVNSIPYDQPIIFAPDQFLGDWVSRETGRPLVLWQGSCEVHENFSQSAIVDLQRQHPACLTLVHPECPLPIRALADLSGRHRTGHRPSDGEGGAACALSLGSGRGRRHLARVVHPLQYLPAHASEHPAEALLVHAQSRS